MFKVFLAVIFSNWAFAAEPLTKECGTRSITILGWQHPEATSQEKADIRYFLEASFKEAQNGDCVASATQLKKLWRILSKFSDSDKNLFEHLQKIQESMEIKTIGMETSPDDWRYQQQEWTVHGGILDFVRKNCANTAHSVQSVSQVLFGPVYQFVYMESHRDVKLQPTEDNDARFKAVMAADDLIYYGRKFPLRLNYDIPKQARESFKRIIDLYLNGKFIPPSDVVEMEKLVKDAPNSELIMDYVRLYKKIMDIQEKRNQAIAEAMLSTRGNAVLVIGNSHGADIASRIEEGCKKP